MASNLLSLHEQSVVESQEFLCDAVRIEVLGNDVSVTMRPAYEALLALGEMHGISAQEMSALLF